MENNTKEIVEETKKEESTTSTEKLSGEELQKAKFAARKNRIKTIAIIFLGAMLVLTFFSNTIMNYSLTQVSTEQIYADVLTNKVRGSGVVEAGSVYNVSLKESRRIATMMVKTDQVVSQGDVLFVLEKTDSEELAKAKEDYRSAKSTYETNVLAAGITVSERKAIERGDTGSLSSRQEKMVSAKNACEYADNNLSYIQNKIDIATANKEEAAETSLEDLENELEIKVIDKTIADMQEDYDKAIKTQDDAQKKVDDLQTTIDVATEAIADAKKDLEKQQAKLEPARKVYETAKSTTSTIRIYRNDAERKEQAAATAFEDYKTAHPDENYSNSGYKAVADAYDKAVSNLSYYETRYTEAQNDEAIKKSNFESIQSAINDLNESIDKQQGVLDKTNSKLQTAASDLKKANEDYNKINKTYSGLTNKKSEITYNADIKKLEDQIAALKQSGKDATSLRQLQLQLTQATTYKAQKEKDLSDLQDFLAKQISLETEYRNIKKLKAQVKELRAKSSECEITAPVAGTITEIALTAGQTIVPDEMIVAIQPESENFTISMDVSVAQARRIKPMDEVSILNNWSAGNITAKVESIRPSKTDKTMNTVKIILMGDVKVGDSYTVSIGTSSSNYEHIVPTSAIKEDSNGKFILTITSKSTPLGNRYYAKRTDVEVLASDDTKSAVSGQFDENPFVITTTTKPVEPGQQVRLADEQK